MKKFFLWSLPLLLVACLFGCNRQGADAPAVSDAIPTDTAQSTSHSTPAAAETAAPPETSCKADVPLSPETYFENAVFVGDSILEGIRQYAVKLRKTEPTLGNAKFIATTIGISIADLVGDKTPCLCYSYGGKEQPLEDILSSFPQVDRIFLMLGLNDLAAVSDPDIGTVTDRYLRLVQDLRRAFPDADIVILTNPPKVASSWLPSYVVNRAFNNALISQFVASVTAMCDENNIPYIDIFAALQDENGNLPDSYCRDGYIHLSDEGARVVVDTLHAFANSLGGQ
ncbi:MAG: hypothetical protein IJX64_07815 [Clostridia bacterium]|nr:hypothetical protein [Clostridia bacterium]